MEEKISIGISEYEKLKRDSAMFHALQAGGVDNWEWYSESLSDFIENDEEQDDEEL